MKSSLSNMLSSLLAQERIAHLRSRFSLVETRANRFMIAVILFFLPFLAPLYHDVFRAYITTPDMDLAVATVVLNFNSGLSQPHYDHTGYVNFLLLSWWIKLGGILGLISATDWKAVLASTDPEQAYAQVVIAGRFYSMLVAGIFSVVFYACLRTLTENRFTALLGGLLFAVSYGLARQSLILRPEMLSALFVITAFLYLLRASQKTAVIGSATPDMAAAGAAVMLAMMTKLQVIFSLLLLPIIIILFGRNAAQDIRSEKFPVLNSETAVYVIATVMFLSPALLFLLVYLRSYETWPGPYDRWSGFYQVFVALYVVSASIVYWRYYGLSRRAWGYGLAAFLCGITAMIYLNFLHFLDFNFVALVNFVDWMKHYAASSISHNADASFSDILRVIANSAAGLFDQPSFREALAASQPEEFARRNLLRGLIDRRFSWGALQQQPVLGLQWLVIIGLAYLFHRRQWLNGIQVAALLAVSLAQEVGFLLRHTSPDYQIYLEPWTIMAFTLLIARILKTQPSRLLNRTALSVVIAGFVLASFYANVERTNVLSAQGGNNVCPFTQGTPIYAIAKKYCDPDIQIKYQIIP